MSAMKQMEKLILTETKGLPPNAINEVLDFIQFIKKKKVKGTKEDIFKDIPDTCNCCINPDFCGRSLYISRP
jgi:hypothetical protein